MSETTLFHGHKIHPAAAIFPMASEAELLELTKSIGEKGLIHPVVKLGDEVIDGRNRLECCVRANVEPHYTTFEKVSNGLSPIDYVMVENHKRRNLSPSQRAAVAAAAIPLYEAEAKARMLAGKAAAEEQAEFSQEAAEDNEPVFNSDEPVTGQIETATPAGGARQAPIGANAGAKAKPTKRNGTKGTSAEKAAKASGASVRSTYEASKLEKENPALFAKVKSGETTLHAALQQADYDAAILRIKMLCGADFTRAIIDGRRLPKKAHVIEMAALSDDDIIRIKPLIIEGWTLKKSISHKARTLCRTHSIGDLLDRAIGNGGIFTLEIEGFEVFVKRAATADNAPKTSGPSEADTQASAAFDALDAAPSPADEIAEETGATVTGEVPEGVITVPLGDPESVEPPAPPAKKAAKAAKPKPEPPEGATQKGSTLTCNYCECNGLTPRSFAKHMAKKHLDLVPPAAA